MQPATHATHVLRRKSQWKSALLALMTHVILATHVRLKQSLLVRTLALLATLAIHVLQKANQKLIY